MYKFIESFELAGTVQDLEDRGWSEGLVDPGIKQVITGGGKGGGSCLRMVGDIDVCMGVGMEYHPYVTVSFWRKLGEVGEPLKASQLLTTTNSTMGWDYGGNLNANMNISCSEYGQIYIGFGVFGGYGGASLNGFVKQGVWQYFEVEFSPTSCSVYVDRKLAVTGTGYEAGQDGTSVVLTGDFNSVNYYSDFVIQADHTQQPPIMGRKRHRVRALLPTGDVAQRYAVGGYLDVDDPFGSSDKSMTNIYLAYDGATAEVVTEDLPAVSAVHAVQTTLDAVAADTARTAAKNYIITDGATSAGVAKKLSIVWYSVQKHIWEDSPKTGAAWTVPEVNNLTLGVEREDW